MRLKQIKLAGFKSFVDPTVAPFPDNLTAIVGPNGCGKSNIIDAVRWVMGESSAKHLRGDSMSDVIFNGSSARKPLAQASVELVFDNSEGKLQGEYAKFNEVSTKRLVTRDGQSQYFLNGTRCRRKDITDIFLGTGLGPRSYAIIEQGMISRLIESKPQELRIFIEEAAGISKYKERRRETENRIRHTKDNLDRLSDLREELGKQLAHLQRQANAAQKYKTFKAEERELKAELAAIRWQALDAALTDGTRYLSDLEVDLEAKNAEQSRVDLLLEQGREEHIRLSENFNDVQAEFYRLGSEIARIEQTIEHNKQRKQQLSEDLAQTSVSYESASEHLLGEQEKIEILQAELTEHEPEYERLSESIELATASLGDLEDDMQAWQNTWESFSADASEHRQRAEVLQTRISHSENLMSRMTQRMEKLEEEWQSLKAEHNDEGLKAALEELGERQAKREELQEGVENVYQSLEAARQRSTDSKAQLAQSQKSYQALKSDCLELEALQKAALNQQSEQKQAWLEEQQLKGNPRVAQLLDVDPTWSLALETVLGGDLNAICVDDLTPLQQQLNPEIGIKLFEKTQEQASAGLDNTLLSKVSGPLNLCAQLQHIKLATDLDEAFALRKSLAPEESVVTPSGHWLGRDWVKAGIEHGAVAGVLGREQELQTLSESLEAAEAQLLAAEEAVEQANEELTQLEREWHDKQGQLNQMSQACATLQAEVGAHQAKYEQTTKRLQKLSLEIEDQRKQVTEEQGLLVQNRQALGQIVDAMAEDADKREALQAEREEKRAQLDKARHVLRDEKDHFHRVSLRVESIKAELATMKQQHQRNTDQITQFKARIEHLNNALAANDEPIAPLKEELATLLEQRIAVESDLVTAKEATEEKESELRRLDKDRHLFEQKQQDVRAKLEKARLECQGLAMQKQTQESQLQELTTSLESVLEGLAEDANEKDWIGKIEAIAAKIQRLGAINLAAIEEFETQSERKTYLDAQNDDLIAALDTLETAIRKIDKETRHRFKETFDQINDGIQELFPKVFGGGQAYLELTGDDLLDTGVAIMARPPGKKNSTIHLLSGGEKALTALSLVFSIFRLNPAPFCMLDEVDAPLDDANVGRFCKLVKEMSKQVQFIFISHNKVTMEMANQMQGVTMHEPGVSRLVSVDIDEAAEMVKSA